MVNNLNSNNLRFVSLCFYFFLFVAFIYQIIISKNLNDVVGIFLIAISNILTIYYCLNKKYFFEYPISLLIIFFSHFFNLGGVIFIKTIEFSLVTDNLYHPIKTITFLIIANLVIIITHYIYMKSNYLNAIKVSITNLFFTKSMKAYLDLLAHILEHGEEREDM